MFPCVFEDNNSCTINTGRHIKNATHLTLISKESGIKINLICECIIGLEIHFPAEWHQE